MSWDLNRAWGREEFSCNKISKRENTEKMCSAYNSPDIDKNERALRKEVAFVDVILDELVRKA